jgi:S-formylglutathione hydrolase FrmB
LKTSTKNLLLFCLFLLLGQITAHAEKKQATAASAESQRVLVRDAVFHSVSLERDMHYRVLFPGHYENGGRFSVLYLLHGIYGDYKNWDTRTGLENYARNLHLLIVMPDANDSWYTNSATVLADKFDDYVAKDLIAEIDKKYRTIHDRHGRAIAGLSMGGYGAVKLAVQYPELFAFAGSLGGAFNAPQNLDSQRPEFRAKLLEVFGNEGSRTRAENDIFLLLNTPHQVPYPYFYVACGTADFFLVTNRALAQQLSSRNLAYEYHETAGGHTWEYWDGALMPLLKAIELKLPNDSMHSPGR